MQSYPRLTHRPQGRAKSHFYLMSILKLIIIVVIDDIYYTFALAVLHRMQVRDVLMLFGTLPDVQLR